MKLGIIGLAGAGKTTLFQTLTKSETSLLQRRQSRIGTVKVPDSRVDSLADRYQPRKTIYAQVEYFLPGPAEHVKESAKEQSIWTQVRDCDALIHVIRNFSDYGQPEPDPSAAFQTIESELMIADLIIVEKRLERLALDQKRGKKPDPDPEEYSLLQQCHQQLNTEKPLRHFDKLARAKSLKGYALLSAKPSLIVFNNADDDDTIPQNCAWIEEEQCMVVRGKLEQELAQMNLDEAEVFLKEFNIADSAMERMIARSYDLLGLISFFTVGEDEVRAWTICRDTVAVDAAEVIHSDIKKGFIRAEVLGYTDFMSAGSYVAARKQGTVRLEGKTYAVQDGDIINFRFNV